MKKNLFDLGMIGLGEMGQNLVLNMTDHGFSVAGYDRDPSRTRSFCHEGADRGIACADTLDAFTDLLQEPRIILMLVPAGAPVDDVIGGLLPFLKPGDLIIDGGNSHFKDTDRRGGMLSGKGILYMGVGISGGGEGARRGPSLMPGGPPKPTSASVRFWKPSRPGSTGSPASPGWGKARPGTTSRWFTTGSSTASCS